MDKGSIPHTTRQGKKMEEGYLAWAPGSIRLITVKQDDQFQKGSSKTSASSWN